MQASHSSFLHDTIPKPKTNSVQLPIETLESIIIIGQDISITCTCDGQVMDSVHNIDCISCLHGTKGFETALKVDEFDGFISAASDD
jgi:hypothetical protein